MCLCAFDCTYLTDFFIFFFFIHFSPAFRLKCVSAGMRIAIFCIMMIWLVGCFGFNGPLRQYFSLYRAVSQREGEREERIDESKNVQTTPTRTYCKRNRPLPYCYQNCRTPRHWKFTQHHRTTRPPPALWWIYSYEQYVKISAGTPMRWNLLQFTKRLTIYSFLNIFSVFSTLNCPYLR